MSVPGPYWVVHRGDEHQVCGRWGKIVQRFSDPSQADALCRTLQSGLRAVPPRVRQPSRIQLAVLRTLERRGGYLSAPGISDVMGQLAKYGWVSIAPRNDGFAIELTDEGRSAIQ